mmetsp:Transcript_3740/g.7542  ORF Transcript_3740/g.7542 Transcript_3740/m.7542 type:complete len:86 (-) Transcript_3740:140-397(-)
MFSPFGAASPCGIGSVCKFFNSFESLFCAILWCEYCYWKTTESLFRVVPKGGKQTEMAERKLCYTDNQEFNLFRRWKWIGHTRPA